MCGGAAVACALVLPPGRTEAEPGSRLLAVPSRPLAALAAIALLAALLEGSVGDWSAVLLSEERDASEASAALGLAAFSLLMGLGRLAADPVAERIGRGAAVRRGALVTAAGALVVVLPVPAALAIAGYAVMGVGLAGVFPYALRAATELEGSKSATAIAAVSTVGYGGFLLGPALIGFLAEATGLGLALGVTVPACLAVAVLAPAARDRARSASPSSSPASPAAASARRRA